MKKEFKEIFDETPRWVKILLASLFLGFIALSFYSWKDYPDDNFIEEAVEEYVEDYTGQELDFTPFSYE